MKTRQPREDARQQIVKAPVALAVLPLGIADQPEAAELAGQLGLPLLPSGSELKRCASATAVLCLKARTLSLQLTGKGAPGPVSVDFGASSMRHRRRSGHNELLGRAVGVGRKSPLLLLDATAGLGRDSFVMADLGCQVRLCERNAVIAEMLARGIEAACRGADPWLAAVASRMQLHRGDARELPAAVTADIDVIYLDPMFPSRDKSAAVKKDMALFQFLLHNSEGGDDALLHWALAQDVARVVVKRPPRAPCLAGVEPSHAIKGKAVRYDVHVRRGLA